MLKLDVYIISVLAFICQVSVSYYTSDTTTTYTYLYKEGVCEVATPSISFTDKYVTIDTPGLEIDKQSWVGYYQKTEYFEYIGCMRSDGFHYTTKLLGSPTPGHCYSACSYTSYIGLEDKSKCHCIQSAPNGSLTEQGCNSPCNTGSNAVCGGHNFTSLYTVVSGYDLGKMAAKDEDKVDKTCLILHANMTKDKPITYKWETCSDKKYVFCFSESNKTVVVYDETKSWKHATTLCFRNHQFPIRVTDIPKINIQDKYAWTGIVRSDVIYDHIGIRKSSRDISYSYVQYNRDLRKNVIKFTKDNNKDLHILCNTIQNTTELTTIYSDTHSPGHSQSTVPKDRKSTSEATKTPVSNAPKTTDTVSDQFHITTNGSPSKEDKDQDSVELSSRIPRLFLIAAGSLIGAASLVAILVFVYYKHTCTRRDENARQRTEEVVVHQRTSDDENMCEVINDVYEHLNEQFKENDSYTEIKRIETQDSNKDYLTPIV